MLTFTITDSLGPTYNAGMANIAEDSVLRNNMIHLLKPDNLALLEDLHRIILVSFLVPRELHPTERTLWKVRGEVLTSLPVPSVWNIS